MKCFTVNVFSVRRSKPLFGGCCVGGSLWEGRSCAERFIFGLLIALIVSVFVIGGLICLQVVTGSTGAGGTLGRAFSALVFAGEGLGLGGVSGVGSVPENLRFHPDKDINILIDDTDLEIVRIKTTEEVGKNTSKLNAQVTSGEFLSVVETSFWPFIVQP